MVKAMKSEEPEVWTAFNWLMGNNPTYKSFINLQRDLFYTLQQPESWFVIPTPKLLLQTQGVEVAAQP